MRSYSLKVATFAFLSALLLTGTASAATSTTVVSHEDEKYFFQDGRMQRFDGQYEMTYFLDQERGILTRTRVYDYRSKRIIPDETQYQIQRQLNSDPLNAPRYSLSPVLRAFGQPDADTVEIVVIRDNSVQTTTSHAGRIVVANCRRLR